MMFRNFVVSICAIAVTTFCSSAESAEHYKPKTLYAFCAETNCTDGSTPSSTLLRDVSGNLYGTTDVGGAADRGVVFQLRPNAKRTKWSYRVLYSFCQEFDCADGSSPTRSPLILDVAGNIFGTTYGGGADGFGTVFELSPTKSGKKWKYNTVYSFSAQQADGHDPIGGVTYVGAAIGARYDDMSPLFGVTLHGGTTDRGTVFELTPSSGRKKSWRESVIFTFCNDCGEAPVGVVSDASGNLFGADGDGIFELSPSNGSNWTETILHVACSETNCADGADPKGAPIFDAQGNLYGTMSSGGNVDEAGVIYKLARVGSAYQYSVLYTFCTNNDCSDCDNPQAGLVMDQSGNLFGTTFNGGPNSAGCVFEMNQSYRIVHAFGIDDSGTSPIAGVILDGSGNLFGATWSNSLYRNGAVFELKP